MHDYPGSPPEPPEDVARWMGDKDLLEGYLTEIETVLDDKYSVTPNMPDTADYVRNMRQFVEQARDVVKDAIICCNDEIPTKWGGNA